MGMDAIIQGCQKPKKIQGCQNYWDVWHPSYVNFEKTPRDFWHYGILGGFIDISIYNIYIYQGCQLYLYFWQRCQGCQNVSVKGAIMPKVPRARTHTRCNYHAKLNELRRRVYRALQQFGSNSKSGG